MTPGTGWVPDDAFLDRVKRAYRIANSEFRRSRFSQWFHIERLQQDVHQALIADDNRALRSIFSDPVTTDLFFGIDNLCKHVFDGTINEESDGAHERQCLEQLAAAVGIAPIDPEQILSELDKKLGARVEFCNPFRGETGFSTSRGVATYRSIQAIYQALRIKQNLREPDAKVLEIGPGMGRTALYGFQSGIRSYTTIDLPLGVVSQACFLGAVLGPENIWMVGDASSADGKIRLLPCTALAGMTENYDLVFNADSIVEMGPVQALKYGAFIRKHAREFLSINHARARIKVWQIALLSFPTRAATRRKYPMREGYLEERFT